MPGILSVQMSDLTVEKATGGDGVEVPYILEVCLDGRALLQLQTHHFKAPGDMAAFTEKLRELCAKQDPAEVTRAAKADAARLNKKGGR